MNPTTHRTTILGLTALLVVAFAFAVGTQASAATLPAGSTITAHLSSSDLNSKNAYVGQPFSMTVVQPYPNGDSSYAGATLYGHVSNVVSASQGRKAQLGLSFDRIVLRNGTTARVYGHLIAADMHEENRNTTRTVVTTVGGMIVGNYIGKHIGTNLGGLVGAAGGYLLGSNYKAQIYIQHNAQAEVQLDHSLTPARRQATRY